MPLEEVVLAEVTGLYFERVSYKKPSNYQRLFVWPYLIKLVGLVNRQYVFPNSVDFRKYASIGSNLVNRQFKAPA